MKVTIQFNDVYKDQTSHELSHLIECWLAQVTNSAHEVFDPNTDEKIGEITFNHIEQGDVTYRVEL